MMGKGHLGNSWSNVVCTRGMLLLAKSNLELLSSNSKGMRRIWASKILSDFVSNPKQPSDYFVSFPSLCQTLTITSQTDIHKSYLHCVCFKTGEN